MAVVDDCEDIVEGHFDGGEGAAWAGRGKPPAEAVVAGEAGCVAEDFDVEDCGVRVVETVVEAAADDVLSLGFFRHAWSGNDFLVRGHGGKVWAIADVDREEESRAAERVKRPAVAIKEEAARKA